MNPSNTVIVISTYKTPIPYADRLRQKGFEVRAYTKENPDSPYNVPKNVGQDATAYLKYIIDNYENLPEYSIMTHDHEYSHHQEGNIVDSIIGQIGSEATYYNFNIVNRGAEFYMGETTQYIKWYDEFLEPYLGPLKQYGEFVLNQKLNGQFLVHKSLITANPKKMYENIYNWFMNSNIDWFISSIIIEIYWILIWRQIPPLSNLPKIAVFTKYSDELDNEVSLKYTDSIFDFFCFTGSDTQLPTQTPTTRWKIIQEPLPEDTKPYFKNYDWIMYIDPLIKGICYDHLFTELYYKQLLDQPFFITIANDSNKSFFFMKNTHISLINVQFADYPIEHSPVLGLHPNNKLHQLKIFKLYND
uniref:Uncharacterized protein n=1 Tax=viral metagenome TaxID=1070528 RepID=A0A6C0IC55_9ZZZZ